MANRTERRTTGGPGYHTLASWEHARTVKGIQLPSGMLVDCDLPDLMAYAAHGTIPSELRPIAHLVESRAEVDMGEISAEEREDFFRLQNYVIATHLRRPDLVKELGSEEAAIDWAENHLPKADRWFLWNHVMTHGIAADVMQAIQTLASRKVGNPGAARFPGVGPSPDPGADGGPQLSVAE